jgi:hypothetical protein
MKRPRLFKPDQHIVSTEQGLAAMRSISSGWPVGVEMFFLTAPFRERWATYETVRGSKQRRWFRDEELPCSMASNMSKWLPVIRCSCLLWNRFQKPGIACPAQKILSPLKRVGLFDNNRAVSRGAPQQPN